MEHVGIFEAKAKLSEICDQVASSRESMIVTRRGKPLVRIVPLDTPAESILERRKSYVKKFGTEEIGECGEDFEPAARSREILRIQLTDD